MGKETTDYQTFKKHVPHGIDRLDRIENLCIVGMPDINFCSGGVECWIELKSPKEPKRKTTPLFGSNHKLSQDQMNWFLRQRNARGNAYVLICTDQRWMLMDGVWADDINTMTVSELWKASVWAATKPIRIRDHWTFLREQLRSRR